MPLNLVTLAYDYYPDFTTGRPVWNGSIYVGDPDTDPEFNQKTVTLRHEGGDTPVSQPITTSSGGVPQYNGSPAQILVDGNYSIKVLNNAGSQVYYVENAFDGAPLTEYDGKYIVPEDTIASMKANTNLSIGMAVQTLGFTTAGDDGQGTYVIAASQAVDGYADHTLSNGNVALLQRKGNITNVMQYGASGGDETKDQPAVIAAVTYLAGLTWPGGTIHFPKTPEPYILSGMVDTLQILFTEQGMTYPPVAAGAYLPNGELARNVMWEFTGDNAQITITSGFSDEGVIKVGTYDTSTGFGQANKIKMSGIEAIGNGSIGHAEKDIFEGKYTIAADVNKGTDNTTTTFLIIGSTIPGSVIDADIRLFNRGVHCKWGFGLTYNSGSVQYCNEGIVAEFGYTNLTLTKAVEVELCAAGLLIQQATDNVCDAIVEANSLAIGLYSATMFECTSWMEGNTMDVAMRVVNAAADHRHIHFNECIGPVNLDSNGGMTEFSVRNSPTGASYTFALSLGNKFENIIFENNDNGANSDGFDLSSLSVTGGVYSVEDITVKGRIQGQTIANYGARECVEMHGSTVSASLVAEKAFDITVPNIETDARIEITAVKTAPVANDMQRQTMRYVGVVSRVLGAASIVEFSTTESVTSNYPTTGTNIPVTIAVPTSTISGAVGDEQTIAINFPTGTATSDTAETIWDVCLNVTVGAVALERG